MPTKRDKEMRNKEMRNKEMRNKEKEMRGVGQTPIIWIQNIKQPRPAYSS